MHFQSDSSSTILTMQTEKFNHFVGNQPDAEVVGKIPKMSMQQARYHMLLLSSSQHVGIYY